MAALTGAPELTLSHFPPNRSEPVLGRSIGDAMREAIRHTGSVDDPRPIFQHKLRGTP
jgi:hypothetical protein